MLTVVHTAVALGVVLLLAAVGRVAARRLRQPEVIGETVVGLVLGPALIALLGAGAFRLLLPEQVLGLLKEVSSAGLVLFLVGLAHHIRVGSARPSRGETGWVAAGSLLPALGCGALLAGWVVLTESPAVRGSAPLPAFVLIVAASLGITAVPVLARILTERGLTETTAGRLALLSAVLADAVGWLILSIAVALNSGGVAGFLRSIAVLLGVVLFAVLLGLLLRTGFARGLFRRVPKIAAVIFGALVLAVTLGGEQLGLTSAISAVAVGLALPAEQSMAVRGVSAVGRLLVPTFFVVTGITVLTTGFAATPWTLIVLATALGIVGKVAGGYLGGRIGGQSRWTAARIGVLMNTRGLTELIVLQVGYSAGILTGPMFLALIVMALVTTVLTGPLLSLVDRGELRRRAATVEEGRHDQRIG